MDSHEIQMLIKALDDACTQARMLHCVADDLEKVAYDAQAAIAALQHEVNERRKEP